MSMVRGEGAVIGIKARICRSHAFVCMICHKSCWMNSAYPQEQERYSASGSFGESSIKLDDLGGANEVGSGRNCGESTGAPVSTCSGPPQSTTTRERR